MENAENLAGVLFRGVVCLIIVGVMIGIVVSVDVIFLLVLWLSAGTTPAEQAKNQEPYKDVQTITTSPYGR